MAYIGNTPAEAYTSIDKQTITGNGGASYTLDHAVANENEIEVFVNNVRQEPSVAYTVSGTALTMTGNVESSDDFYVVFQGKAIQTTAHPEGQDLKARNGTFNVSADGGVLDFQKNGSSVGGIDTRAGRIKIGDGDVGFFFDDANNRITPEGLTNSSANDASINLGGSTQRWKDLYLSGGVYLGGTGNANKLDDYEEGTWTPAFGVNTGSNATYTYTNQVGNYTKVGNMVHVNAHVSCTARSGGNTGAALTVTGLPFGNTSGWKAGTVGYAHGFSLLANECLVETAQSRLRFYSIYGGSHSNVTLSAIPTSGTVNLYFAASYQTSV